MNGKLFNQNRKPLLQLLALLAKPKSAAAATIGLVSALTLASHATADTRASVQKVGRWLGVGWGDGYHSCKDSGFRPCADMPPQSYTDQLPKPKKCRGECGPIYPPGTGLPKIPHSPQVSIRPTLPGASSCDLGCDQVTTGCDASHDNSYAELGIVITGETNPEAESNEIPSYAVPITTEQAEPIDISPTQPRTLSPTTRTESERSAEQLQQSYKPVAPTSPTRNQSSQSETAIEEALLLPDLNAAEEPSPSDQTSQQSLSSPIPREPVQRLPAVKRMPPAKVNQPAESSQPDDLNLPVQIPVNVPKGMFNEPQTNIPPTESDRTGMIAAMHPAVKSNPYFAAGQERNHESSSGEPVRIATRPGADSKRDWNPIRQPD